MNQNVFRPVGVSLLLCITTMIAGLTVRFVPLHLPSPLVKYGGSTLWALLVYWVVSGLLPQCRLGTAVLFAGCLTTAIEFFKLYRSPGVDVFRHTIPGILLLGRVFSAWDLLAYWAAIVTGAWFDRRLRLGKAPAKKKEATP